MGRCGLVWLPRRRVSASEVSALGEFDRTLWGEDGGAESKAKGLDEDAAAC